MAGTYAAKGTRRYAFYETRKDLARPQHPPATRCQRGLLEQHVLDHLGVFLLDEHALRRVSGAVEAGQLASLFHQGRALQGRLQKPSEAQAALRSLVRSIRFGADQLEITLVPAALGMEQQSEWKLSVPRPAPRPFRKARLRIDPANAGSLPDAQMLDLLADAAAVQKLVLASPELSINQLAKGNGRCRKQMAKLLKVSFLSPRIVEAIIDGMEPRGLNRARLLEAELPLDWAGQEALLGFAA